MENQEEVVNIQSQRDFSKHQKNTIKEGEIVVSEVDNNEVLPLAMQI